MKEFRVQTLDYSRELHKYVIVDTQDFDTESKAWEYADSIEPTSDSVSYVTSDYGYHRLAKKSKGEYKKY